MVPGDKGEGDLVVLVTLLRGQKSGGEGIWGGKAHAWVCDEAGGLGLDDALDELDAAYAHTGRSRVHAA